MCQAWSAEVQQLEHKLVEISTAQSAHVGWSLPESETIEGETSSKGGVPPTGFAFGRGHILALRGGTVPPLSFFAAVSQGGAGIFYVNSTRRRTSCSGT